MVSTTFLKLVSPCWKPSFEGENSNRGDVSGRIDGLLWHKDSGRHVNGDFSMAVIQANNLLEDHSQLESGPLSSLESGPHGTFVGIYDGHGGPETARFLNEHLFNNIKSNDKIRKIFKCYPAFGLWVYTFIQHPRPGKLGLVVEKGKEFLSHFVLLFVFYVVPLLKNLVTWPKKLQNMMVDSLGVL